MAAAERLLILDACVLIDICLEDPTLLGLAASSLGRVVVLSPILAEVVQLDDAEVERLGLTVVEPETELAIEASARRGGLSFRDRMCLLFSRHTKGALYTNDKALFNAAGAEGVEVRWGLEILLDLVAAGQLGHSDAATIAQRICDRSRFPSDPLIAEFRRRLGRL